MLIAEIGNNHFGDFNQAKELIKVSKECGADLVKGQYFGKDFVFKNGSMPEEFYNSIKFTKEQYIELIEYAKSIGIPMFYSYFTGSTYEADQTIEVIKKTPYIKFSAGQYDNNSDDNSHLLTMDNSYTIVSMKLDVKYAHPFKLAKVLLATPYMWENNKKNTETFMEAARIYYQVSKREPGLSDHCLGIAHIINILSMYKIPIIEKHICLKKYEPFNGFVFRDTIHGSDPKEFEKLAKQYKEKL